MSSPRFGAAAVLLPSGKVLVAGGCNVNCSVAQPTVDLYDSGTGTWSPTRSMLSPRYFFTATLLQNGRVLAAGGCNLGNCGSAATAFKKRLRPATLILRMVTSIRLLAVWH